MTENREQDGIVTRRGLVNGGVLAGASALAVALTAGRFTSARAQDDATPVGDEEPPFADEVEVLNYALTLEHLESAFYREGLETFAAADYEALGFQAGVRDYIAEIGAHEEAHVTALTETIESLDGTPVEEGEYDFGYADLAGFLAVAAALENTGVGAYTGAAQYLIEEDELLTAALTIHGVEARHAAYLNVLTAVSPFPDAVDAPLTPAEVLEIATPFIVSS